MSSSIQTDLYQLTMAYAYWKAGKHNDLASFEMFFRKCPFNGEYAVFAGLSECINYIKNFKFTEEDINYIRTLLPQCVDHKFYEYLASLDSSSLEIRSIKEGTFVFPKVPIMMVQGSLVICQIIESSLLNLVSFASLICTNAIRHRLTVGPDCRLYEFGLRRAQGPDGAMTASKYSFLGGFDGTSNVLAGKLYDIPVVGTHAHSFVSSFASDTNITPHISLNEKDDDSGVTNLNEAKKILEIALQSGSKSISTPDSLFSRAKKWLTFFIKHVESTDAVIDQVHLGDLEAFSNFAYAFPDRFLALIDTYATLESGLPSFCAVALALAECGYKALGIRIDSGDLAYQSRKIRSVFRELSEKLGQPFIEKWNIIASNDLDEDTIRSIQHQGHAIDCFAVGTNLVTCKKQPSMGCVYKLVEINGHPTMKLSANIEKASLPGRKRVFRLYSQNDLALADLMQLPDEPAPKVGHRTLIRHVMEEHKRAFVVPSRVVELHDVIWKNNESYLDENETLAQSRDRTLQNIKEVRQDHLRALNPTPYKVSVSDALYKFIHEIWFNFAPITELS